MAVVELAEPRCCAKLERTMRAGLCLEAPACKCIVTGWDSDAGRYLERRQKSLAVRIPVELEAVACFHANVDWSQEISSRFQKATRLSHSSILICKKFLAYTTTLPTVGSPRFTG